MTHDEDVIRVGISGWTYGPWRGTFYPQGLPVRRQLAYVAERMTSVEVNGSFYGLLRPSSYAGWVEAVAPVAEERFVLAVKGSRFITHMRKLVEPANALANFYASGVLALGTRTGPFLWQLPATFRFDEARLAAFLDALPRTAGEAAALAVQHDARVPEDRALTTAPLPDLPLRHAVEVRHESFRTSAFTDLLRHHGVALVHSDNPGTWPVFDEVTAPFAYVRLHGHDELYASGYDDDQLDAWAARLREWDAAGLDAYVYCDNDAKVRAPFDAINLLSRVGGAHIT
ncbi:Uncharacterized conserved protein YecE, DUF72 family [Microlunatus sagamiharensis]|uniref:Uncharacterized conserved protein YecE, DUF72 family n=1 Tax=Microlunatus sagamiharensis TaxID=546874 RepID=A0A1H2NEK1_9ACTN|nr:DUF72 domain-containing protein [Microlunatus sagamiharensis]SDV03545.1 Uncharacterized conserved protein YecE, DUF72 family [Microlunatus sagamiharensis]